MMVACASAAAAADYAWWRVPEQLHDGCAVFDYAAPRRMAPLPQQLQHTARASAGSSAWWRAGVAW